MTVNGKFSIKETPIIDNGEGQNERIEVLFATMMLRDEDGIVDLCNNVDNVHREINLMTVMGSTRCVLIYVFFMKKRNNPLNQNLMKRKSEERKAVAMRGQYSLLGSGVWKKTRKVRK